jgi:solute carrier family 25 aspartate/glutamate transporter 12/13
MRSLLLTDGQHNFALELIAGCAAGGSQVIFTNPVEMIKIRLQIQGENIRNGLMKASERQSALAIFKEIGVRKLYSGASACLMRDVPFSGMYFTIYARMKKLFASSATGTASPGGLLVAGALSGIPAAALVTPADVVKTRLQAKQLKTETPYKGIRDCAKRIWANEGASAFFKGAGARVARSSPQFGVTLFTYELLQRKFYPSRAN